MKTGDERTVLVVGPGPVTLEQGAGFQYLAARVCRCLRGRGFRVAALEDNPATLLDDGGGDAGLYVEAPLPEVVARVAVECGASSLWLGPAGRRGWVLARELAAEGWLERTGLRVADLPDRVLWACGDRSLLRETLETGGISNPDFRTASNLREAQEAASEIGYPVVLRPHFSCGGWGAGVAFNREELPGLFAEACGRSPGGEVLLEEYLGGWRKYIACVLRDGRGRAETAGMMEQLEPLPRHEEDSVVIVPPLPRGELFYALEEVARVVAELLDYVGLLEVKMTVSPGCEEVFVLDVDAGPRRITPLLEVALGVDLVGRHVGLLCGGAAKGVAPCTELPGTLLAFPRFFYPEEEGGEEGHLPLGCRAVGRTVVAGRTAWEAARTALRLLEEDGRGVQAGTRHVLQELAMRAGGLRVWKAGAECREAREAEEHTFPSAHGGTSEGDGGNGDGRRYGAGGAPIGVETEGHGFPLCLSGPTPGTEKRGMMFLAPLGPRPGSGLEFHFALFRALRAWRERGGRAAVYTVDPGFALYLAGEADAVFLGPPSTGGVRRALLQAGMGSLCPQFGGEEAFALARRLSGEGGEVEVMGGVVAEDPPRFLRRLRSSRLPLVPMAVGREEADQFLRGCRFPVHLALFAEGGETLKRVFYSPREAEEYLFRHPEGTPLLRELREDSLEVLVEAVAGGGRLYCVLAWERLQGPGGDAGDGPGVYPPLHLTSQQYERLREVVGETVELAGWNGNLSLRLMVEEGEMRIWDLSPGTSEQLPFLARASSLDLAEIGLAALLGEEPSVGLEGVGSAVRYPVSPLGVIAGEDILLNPCRRHTGEVMGVGDDPGKALAGILRSLGMRPRPGGRVLLSVANREKRRAVLLARELSEAGYRLAATRGTARALRAAGMEVEEVNKLREGRPHVLDLIRNGEVQLVVNIPRGRHPHSDGFYIREDAARHGIPCLTDMEAALALVRGIRAGGEEVRTERGVGLPFTGVSAGGGG
ncbi:MAG: ATP-grasp domain-containing protein [Actinobacteria bacterium]|nr:ATP-grasp domain-containing protein [Actinomycetota bacterium]